MGRAKPLLMTPPEGYDFGRAKLHKVLEKALDAWRGTRFFFKRPLPKVFCPLSEPLRGVGDPTVAGPRAEWGGGEVNLPPSLTY